VTQEEINAYLEETNAFRARHGAPPLTWDSGLAKEAYSVAKQNAADSKLQHIVTSGHGQNLYYGTRENLPRSPLTSADASWQDEKKLWDKKSTKTFYGDTGHYTQVVWKATTRVGCGVADGVLRGSDGNPLVTKFVACNYSPAGNVLGQFDTQVS
jgi:uncharacterized protein YkwD